MVSASKIGSMVPSQLVDAVSDHLPDRLPDLPDLPVHLGDVTDRLRQLPGVPGAKRRKVRARGRLVVPLAVAGVLAGLYLVRRSRRSTTSVGADSPAEAYAHT
jgi:hypothetical protein